MPNSTAALASRPGSAGFLSAVLALATVLLLAALVILPLLALLVNGIRMPPSRLVVTTLGIAITSTLGALVLASALAAAVRARTPGSRVVRTVFRVGLLLPPFVVPIALIALAGHDAGTRVGRPAAIVVAQVFTFLPIAFALVMRALAVVSAEAQQAAELLGASRWTVFRRVTLGLARPGLIRAALLVLGLCLADVVTPLLLGAENLMLAPYVVSPADSVAAWTGGALALSILTGGVALAGRTWRDAAVPLAADVAASGVTATTGTRAILAALAWLITAPTVVLWLTVPLASVLESAEGWRATLENWNQLRDSADALVSSVLLGLGTAVIGTALALVAAAVARGRGPVAVAVTWLTRVPVAIPGAVAGVGHLVNYLMTFGAPEQGLTVLMFVLAAWGLPFTAGVAARVLARADRTAEQAAVILGASRLTALRRIVVPSLVPAAASIAGYGFASGVTAVATVIVLVVRGHLDLGIVNMLLFTVDGSVGPACAIATTLVTLAAGARLLARTVAGRDFVPTLLA
jgi:iron(III) transport system permease protein